MLVDKLHIDPDFIQALPNHITVGGETNSYKSTLAALLAGALAKREGLTHVLGYHPLAGLPLETDPEDTAVIFDGGGLMPNDVYFDPLKHAVGVITLQGSKAGYNTAGGEVMYSEKDIVGSLVRITDVDKVYGFDHHNYEAAIQVDLMDGSDVIQSTTISFAIRLLQPRVHVTNCVTLQEVLGEATVPTANIHFAALLLEGIDATVRTGSDKRGVLDLTSSGPRITINDPSKDIGDSAISMSFQNEDDGGVKVYVGNNSTNPCRQIIVASKDDLALAKKRLGDLRESNFRYRLVHTLY